MDLNAMIPLVLKEKIISWFEKLEGIMILIYSSF